MSRRLSPEDIERAVMKTREEYGEIVFPNCPLCKVPMNGGAGLCPECGLYYNQAETLVRLQAENDELRKKIDEEKAKTTQGVKFKRFLLKVLLNLAGCLAAFVAFFLIYIALYWIITFIGRIPLLGAIIYWPSDASWVRLVTCISSAVFGGAWLSTVIAKNAKLFSSAIIAIHIFTVVRLSIASAFTFTNLIECAVAIICAAMCLLMRKDDA